MLVHIINATNQVTHKAVQLYIGKEPFLVLGIGKSDHHTILSKFLRARGLEFHTMQAPGSEEIFLVPALEGDHYNVVGMGRIDLMSGRKLYKPLGDSSKDYKIGINQEHSDLVSRQLESFGWKRP